MCDFRKENIAYLLEKDRIIIKRGNLFLCEIINSKEFKEILCGNFDKNTGFTGDTLIEIGKFVKKLENKRKENESSRT